MKVIDKVGKFLDVKKDNYDYECQYAWAVVLMTTFVIGMTISGMALVGIIPYIIFGTFFCIPAYCLYVFLFFGIFEKQFHVLEFTFTRVDKFVGFVITSIIKSVDFVLNYVDTAIKNVMKKYCKPIIKEEE